MAYLLRWALLLQACTHFLSRMVVVHGNPDSIFQIIQDEGSFGKGFSVGNQSEWGNGINCNHDYPQTKMTLLWHPKNISLTKTEALQLALTMHAPTNFSSGVVNVNLFVEDLAHPILTMDKLIDCDLFKLLPSRLRCPVHETDLLWIPVMLPKDKLSVLYTGSFRIVASMKNEKDKMFVCVELKVNIMP